MLWNRGRERATKLPHPYSQLSHLLPSLFHSDHSIHLRSIKQRANLFTDDRLAASWSIWSTMIDHRIFILSLGKSGDWGEGHHSRIAIETGAVKKKAVGQSGAGPSLRLQRERVRQDSAIYLFRVWNQRSKPFKLPNETKRGSEIIHYFIVLNFNRRSLQMAGFWDAGTE